jgi:O-acetylhomoserine (thiol)-lyase
MGEKALKAAGITEETIRISVGVESAQDLVDDLSLALSSHSKTGLSG